MDNLNNAYFWGGGIMGDGYFLSFALIRFLNVLL